MFDYGHLRSALTRRVSDAAGQPTPWYTYPTIEYLKGLDFTAASVFEYGAGYSTLFWAARAKSVVSVEDDEEWYGVLAPKMPPNGELLLETDLRRYVEVISRYPDGFDVIVVDGAARGLTRLKCSAAALAALRKGGLIILDNADWLPESARLLRDAGLIQVDMTGFIAISGYTQTTSLFFDREFALRPRAARQPVPGPGADDKVWEHQPPTEAPLLEFGGEVFGAVRRDQPFEMAAPAGTRPFRLVVAGRSQYGSESAALLDVHNGRVLLAITEPSKRMYATVEEELAPVMSMTWERFVAFVNGHHQRRYRLEP
jgi:hypothetical protein